MVGHVMAREGGELRYGLEREFLHVFTVRAEGQGEKRTGENGMNFKKSRIIQIPQKQTYYWKLSQFRTPETSYP